MPSTYSTNLALELIGTGDQAGTWGNTTNTNLGTLIEQAISGYVTQAVATGTDTTITIPNGATGVARNMYIELTGTGGTNTNLIVPSNKKLYFIFNNSTGAVTVKVTGQTGVSVPQGKKMVLVSNGTDIVNGINYIADFGTNSFTVTNLTATSASITTLTGTSANITTLSGTTATFTSASVTNLTATSIVISNLSIASANITTLTSSSATISTTLALSGGTANGVLYLNGSKVATSGSALQFDGTNLGIGTTSPSSQIQVVGSTFAILRLSAAAGDNNARVDFGTAASPDIARIGYNNSTNAFTFRTNGADAVTINSSQNVGIGTSSPSTKLNVVGTVTVDGVVDVNGGQIDLDTGQPIRWGGAASGIYAGSGTNDMVFTVGSAERFRVNGASGNLGIGTSSPAYKLDVVGDANFSSTVSFGSSINLTANGSQVTTTYAGVTTSRFFTSTSGLNLSVDGAWPLIFTNNSTERMRLDSSGNLGLGVTPSAWSTLTALQMPVGGLAGYSGAATNKQFHLLNNAYYGASGWTYRESDYAQRLTTVNGQYQFHISPQGTAGNAISFTQAMTLDASGNLSLGTTGNTGRFDVRDSSSASRTLIYAYNSGSGDAVIRVGNAQNGAMSEFGKQGVTAYGATAAGDAFLYTTQSWSMMADAASGVIKFSTGGNTERARITAGGDFLVGKTANDTSNEGFVAKAAGGANITSDDSTVLEINRKTSDGTLVSFRQDNTQEGTISVSGNTVSYNAFAGSHWSQLQDGSKPDILRGTVMESINELCVWPGEQNERLPKSKISDTAGSKKVYGVFMAWDNDWTETNDMYVTAVGAFICRVNGSVTVQEGDLLESNGDGTARVQADDIIRSSTIGKVTSTVKTHQYDDGSYCVPTVLYCG